MAQPETGEIKRVEGGSLFTFMYVHDEGNPERKKKPTN
jgi:hypothetical protein